MIGKIINPHDLPEVDNSFVVTEPCRHKNKEGIISYTTKATAHVTTDFWGYDTITWGYPLIRNKIGNINCIDCSKLLNQKILESEQVY